MTVKVDTWKCALESYSNLYVIMRCKTNLVEFWIAAVELGQAKIGNVPVKLQPIVKMTCNNFAALKKMK